MSNWAVVSDPASLGEAQASPKLGRKEVLSGAHANVTHSAQQRTPHPLDDVKPSAGGTGLDPSSGHGLQPSGWAVWGGDGTERHTHFSAGALPAPLKAGSTRGPGGNEFRLSDSHPEAGPTISPCSLGPKEPLLIPKQHLSSRLHPTWPLMSSESTLSRQHPHLPAFPFLAQHEVGDYF